MMIFVDTNFVDINFHGSFRSMRVDDSVISSQKSTGILKEKNVDRTLNIYLGPIDNINLIQKAPMIIPSRGVVTRGMRGKYHTPLYA